MSSTENQRYWFPAKRYGWGWGLPATWQGWVVLAGYVVALLAGVPQVRSALGDLAAFAYLLVLSAALIVICWRKGEPPRWRWGHRDGGGKPRPGRRSRT